MTKQKIASILKNISDSCDTDTTNNVTMFHINDTRKCFSIRITVGTIYCDCVRIDDSEVIQFINDGKIIAILDYLFIEKIDLL